MYSLMEVLTFPYECSKDLTPMKKPKKTVFTGATYLRSVALFTLLSFIATQALLPSPVSLAMSTGQTGGKQAQDSKVPGGDPVTASTGQVLDGKIAVPPELGTIDEVYRTPRPDSRKTIVFIQDAHDSLEAQENISKIINRMVANCGVRTVFEEGYEGPVPTDQFFGFIKDPAIKEKVSYFLMDHLRVGGAEYAHINRKLASGVEGIADRKIKDTKGLTPHLYSRSVDFQLIGADSLKLHKENILQYRLSAGKKEAIAQDLKALGREVRSHADKRFPKELLGWLKLKNQFDHKTIDLLTYLERSMPLLGMSAPDARAEGRGAGMAPLLRFVVEAAKTQDPAVIEKAKHIDAREVYGALGKLEETIREGYLKDPADKELFGYAKVLGLLERLNDLQVTQEEYEAVKIELKTFSTTSLGRFIHEQTLKPLVLSKQWERNVLDAIRFYEIAAERDNAIAATLDKYFLANTVEGTGDRKIEKNEPAPKPYTLNPRTAVLVYGGFHKENIKRILEAKGISYCVVSPRIMKPSPRHEDYYKKLMTVGSLPFERAIAQATATSPQRIFENVNGSFEIHAVYDAARLNPGADVSLLEKYLPPAKAGLPVGQVGSPVAGEQIRSEARKKATELPREGNGTRDKADPSRWQSRIKMALPSSLSFSFFVVGMLADLKLEAMRSALHLSSISPLLDWALGWAPDFLLPWTFVHFVMGGLYLMIKEMGRPMMDRVARAVHMVALVAFMAAEITGPWILKNPKFAGATFSVWDLAAIAAACAFSYGLHAALIAVIFRNSESTETPASEIFGIAPSRSEVRSDIPADLRGTAADQEARNVAAQLEKDVTDFFVFLDRIIEEAESSARGFEKTRFHEELRHGSANSLGLIRPIAGKTDRELGTSLNIQILNNKITDLDFSTQLLDQFLGNGGSAFEVPPSLKAGIEITEGLLTSKALLRALGHLEERELLRQKYSVPIQKIRVLFRNLKSQIQTATSQISARAEVREELDSFMASFEGSIYYPAGGTDFYSVRNLAKIFPKLKSLTFADNFDPYEKALPDIIGGGGAVGVLWQMKKVLGKLGFLFAEWEVQRQGEDLAINLTHTRLWDKDVAGRRMTIRYLIQDLFRVDEQFDAVFVQFPGMAGHLAERPEFWRRIHSQTKRYLFLGTDTKTPPPELFEYIASRAVDAVFGPEIHCYRVLRSEVRAGEPVQAGFDQVPHAGKNAILHGISLLATLAQAWVGTKGLDDRSYEEKEKYGNDLQHELDKIGGLIGEHRKTLSEEDRREIIDAINKIEGHKNLGGWIRQNSGTLASFKQKLRSEVREADAKVVRNKKIIKIGIILGAVAGAAAVIQWAVYGLTGINLWQEFRQAQQTPGFSASAIAAGIALVMGIAARIIGMILSDTATRRSPLVVSVMFGMQVLWRPLVGAYQVAVNWFIEAHFQEPAMRAFVSLVLGFVASIIFDLFEPVVLGRLDAKQHEAKGDFARAEEIRQDLVVRRQLWRIWDGIMGRLASVYLQQAVVQNVVPMALRPLVYFGLSFFNNTFRSMMAFTKNPTLSTKGVAKWGFLMSAGCFLVSATTGVAALLITSVSVYYFYRRNGDVSRSQPGISRDRDVRSDQTPDRSEVRSLEDLLRGRYGEGVAGVREVEKETEEWITPSEREELKTIISGHESLSTKLVEDIKAFYYRPGGRYEGLITLRISEGRDFYAPDDVLSNVTEMMESNFPRAAEAIKGKRVLVLGAGYGESSYVWAYQAGAKEVVGVESNPLAASLGKVFINKKGVPLDYRDMNALDLTLRDGEFDVVICDRYLNLMPPVLRYKALYEAARVLKPGGDLWIFSHYPGMWRDVWPEKEHWWVLAGLGFSDFKIDDFDYDEAFITAKKMSSKEDPDFTATRSTTSEVDDGQSRSEVRVAGEPAGLGSREETEKAFRSFEAFERGSNLKTPRRGRSTWVKPFHGFMVDQIFQRYQDEKEKISLVWARNILREFFVETFREKFFSIFRFKETFKALWRQLSEYGRDVVIFVVAYNLLEDYLLSPILLFLKMPALAAFVFFGHFEWIVYPAYFAVRQKLKKTFQKQLRPAEKEKLRGFLKNRLSEAAGVKGRWEAVKKLLWIHPNLPKLLNETLLRAEDAGDVSSVTHISIRELYFKCMGRILRKEGLKSKDARRGFELILRGLGDNDPWVRKVCAGAIGKFAERLDFGDGMRAYSSLVGRFSKETEVTVREAILRSLGALPCDGSLEILTGVLKDPEAGFWAKKYAAESTGKILEHLKLDREVPLSDVIVDAIHALLAQLDPEEQRSVAVRVAAVDALARLREDTHPGLEPLRGLINGGPIGALWKDPDPTVREHALWAIARHSLVEREANGARAQAFERILIESLDGNFINVAELSERYLRYLYRIRPAPFPKELKIKVQKALERSRIAKPVIFIAVDSLFEEGRDRVSVLSSPKVEAFVKRLRDANNLVLYARNFLKDRNRSAIQPDGDIEVFDDFDLARFADVMDRLRKGKPAHVPWIDFARGVIASTRTPDPESGRMPGLHRFGEEPSKACRSDRHEEPPDLARRARSSGRGPRASP